MVHISEVANKRVGNIAEELSVGQAVEAKILDIDTERKRISLSIKQALEENFEENEEESQDDIEDQEAEDAAEVSETTEITEEETTEE